jgi:putative ABC transport system permease protein
LVRFFLRLYPEDIRGITRAEMEETFFDRVADGASLPHELRNLVWTGLGERWGRRGGLSGFSAFRDDLRFGLRSLSKNRVFSIGAVVMLALGIGVNTAMFSMNTGMARVVQRFRDPETLVFLWRVEDSWNRGYHSALDLLDYQTESSAFTELEFYSQTTRYLTGQDGARRLAAIQASGNLLPMLGLTAEVGRLHGPGDEDPGAPAVAVLTHRLWLEAYGGTPEVLGQTILLDGLPHTVIGILQDKVEFEMLWRGAGVFLPLPSDQEETDRGRPLYGVIGRLRDGTSLEQAQTQVTGIAARIAESHPETNEGVDARLEPFEEFFYSSDDKLAMAASLLAVVAVLLIACVNLANLLLTKGADRQGEVAIRLAVGASRGRVIRQLLVESLVLAIAAGAIGLILGMWGIDILLSSLPSTPFLEEEVGLDPVLLLYTFGVSVAAALVFGLTPALLASRASLGESTKEGGRGISASVGRKRFRNGILVTQLALTVPLTLSCIVGYRHVQNLGRLDFGVPTEDLLILNLDLPLFRYPNGVDQAAFYREVLDAVEGVPAVAAAGAGLSIPIGAGNRTFWGPVTVEGQEDAEPREGDVRGFWTASEGYFPALGVPLRSGRFFSETDGPEDLPVGIINERMALHYWPGEDAVGKRLTVVEEPTPDDWIVVVGVVADFGATFHGDPPDPTLFLPHSQRPSASMLLVVRTDGDPLSAVPAIRQTIQRVDAGVPISSIRTGEGLVDAWLQESRTVSTTLGLLGVLALGLAVVGLYGMVAYSVARRTFEIGVRLVIGASRGAIRMTVMRSFLILAGIGLTIGLGISLVVAVVLRSQMAFLQVPYPSTVGGLVVLLVGVVLLASYLPARRATSIEPVVALRSQ